MTAPTPRDPALDAAYEEVAKKLVTGKRFLITGHRNPDGDALGSALGLALALDATGKEARVVMRDSWSSAYSKMPGIARVAVSESLPSDWPSGWDALFTMECPEADRAGFSNLLAGTVVNVDHHPGNTRYGSVNLVDLPAAAVGEMVADLLDLVGWPLTKDIATNLWVSLVSDTGSFRYSNTTPKALALGARLVAAGAEPGPVNEFLFEAAPLSSLKLEALVLGTLELHAGGTVATVELPRRFFDQSGAKESDTEGLVNRARGIEGVRAAALLREGDGGEIRCSLRSKGVVDIRSVAARHAGGGHRNASGCRVQGTLAFAKSTLVSEIAAAIVTADATTVSEAV
ncbi:MAG: DHH family phosphoesterase [Acidobacteriota bacterium]|nr:DHH family phosphoesterase [Acidobacteriota bacterium]